MNLALLAVAGAAVCSGSAAVLQASAVAGYRQADSMSAGFVGRLARSPRYLLALVLVAAGFGLSILALRTLPLFVVQAGRASSLAITAVLSVLLLRVRLRTAEVIAVIGIGAGLVVVAATAGPAGDCGGRVRGPGRHAGGRPAGCASPRPPPCGSAVRHMPGWCWPSSPGCASACSRSVRVCCAGSRRPSCSPTRPRGRWPAPAGSGCCWARWRCSVPAVVTVTSAMVATETVVGAALGMIICDDRPAAGLAAAAIGGFLLVLAGALVLARFGAPAPDARGHEEPAALPIA